MEKLYVIKNNETGKFIAIDRSSGGYPYDTELQHAATFNNKEQPLSYRDTMKADWSLCELTLTTTETSWRTNMKSTGKINPITGDEILRAEEHDIDFWETKWDDLTIQQKATFCSFIGAEFLGKQNEAHVRARYYYFRLKNL